MLDIEIHRPGDEAADSPTVCYLEGDLVATETPWIRALGPSLPEQGSVLVDLTGVRSFDRPGLAALIGTLASARGASGRVTLFCTLPSMLRLLRAEGIDRLFPIVASSVEVGARG